MAYYVGFSTINANKPQTTNPSPTNPTGNGTILSPVVPGKKFRLTDQQLILQDLINALNIPQGQKVGQPGYGTNIWSFTFEQMTNDMQLDLETEIRRVASADPRLTINTINFYPQENGLLVELEIAVTPFNQVNLVNIFLNPAYNSATLT